jgi:hypothetical protein
VLRKGGLQVLNRCREWATGGQEQRPLRLWVSDPWAEVGAYELVLPDFGMRQNQCWRQKREVTRRATVDARFFTLQIFRYPNGTLQAAPPGSYSITFGSLLIR